MPSIKGFEVKNGQLTPETVRKLRNAGVDMFQDQIKPQTGLEQKVDIEEVDIKLKEEAIKKTRGRPKKKP